jgi:3'(2'), 5'-bisphosphate nucleotidase
MGYLRGSMRQEMLISLMDHAIEAALGAGHEILEVQLEHAEVEMKSDRSPLTLADRRAHSFIGSTLKATGLQVLSEEGADVPLAERRAWSHYWLVDPLDGTKEFIKGNGEYSVNIALMENREDEAVPVAGVLYAPVKDLLYFAWKDGGAYRQQQAATVTGVSAYERACMSTRLPLDQQKDTFTIVASRSHLTPATAEFIRQAEVKHGKVRTINMGSALKICLVAEGTADVYPRSGPTMEWDTAAGHAICLEAGRDLRNAVTGGRLRYNKQDLTNDPFIVE